MAKITTITEHFQHFLADLQESFWGDLEAKTRLAWKHFFESESERMRSLWMGYESYERGQRPASKYRNGYYERDFVTRFGTIRLRIARARGKSFLPAGLEKFQRRAPELALLIREAFLRGISTRQVGAGGSDADRRNGERADGFRAHPRSGRCGAAVPPGAVAG